MAGIIGSIVIIFNSIFNIQYLYSYLPAGQRPIISTSEEVESYLQGFTNLTITVGASISILSGSGIRLLCPVRGVPKPVVSWRVRSKAKRNRAVFDQASNSLTIPRLSPLDFGNYICTAKNILGETSTSSAVNVIGEQEVYLTPFLSCCSSLLFLSIPYSLCTASLVSHLAYSSTSFLSLLYISCFSRYFCLSFITSHPMYT